MNREKKLVKNTLIITIGRVATQLISFFLLPLYTAVLTTEEYGIVDLLNTYISLFVPVVTLQIEQAIFRFLIENRDSESNKKSLISTAITIEIIQSILYILIFSLLSKYINNNYKYFLATNVVASIFSVTMLQISRGLGDNLRYTIGSVITAVFSIIFNIIFILIFRIGAYGILLATFLGNLICTLYIFFSKKIYRYISIKDFNFNNLKKMFRYSIPLIPNAISWWIINTSDKAIVSSILGVATNGIYSVANKFSTIAITIYNMFNMSWTESVALHINDKDSTEYISKTMASAFKFFSSLYLGIISCMPFVFPIMINEKFSEAYYQIPILMLAALCNTVIGLISAIYVAKKDTKVIAKTSIISAIINITTNFALIKFIGLFAASISTFLAYFCMMIFRIYDVQKYLKVKIESKMILMTTITTLIICIAYYMNNLILNVLTLNFMIIYAIFNNKEIIQALINVLKNKLIKYRKV